MTQTIRRLLSIFAYAITIVALAMISACGSGGDSEVKTDDDTVTADSAGDNQKTGDDDNSDDSSGSDSSEGNLYVVLQVHSSDARNSGYSNEARFSASPGETISISWKDPTRRVNDECLMQNDIEQYSLRYGTEENSYDFSTVVSKTGDRGLICQPTATVDGSCGSVYKCDYSFDVDEGVNV